MIISRWLRRLYARLSGAPVRTRLVVVSWSRPDPAAAWASVPEPRLLPARYHGLEDPDADPRLTG